MAPVEPLAHSKKVVSKGKAVLHLTMQLWARNVTQIATPTPEVDVVMVPPPPIAGPIRAPHGPLFTEPNGSGDEQIRKGAPVSSGE